MFEKLTNATLKIESGNSSGSGFHFVDKQIIVTNYHVILSAIQDPSLPIIGITEKGISYRLQIISYSSIDQYDFAILHSIDKVEDDRIALQPKVSDRVRRGTDIIFAGYPHGISHLLVHKAVVSGYPNDKSFYIDGSVNGGNSGGPVVDMSDFSVVGIVTQRRFLGNVELHKISDEATQLQDYCNKMQGNGSVNIMGIDFTAFAKMIGKSFAISNAIIESNANSGIGIGFNIKYVTERYNSLPK